MPHRLEENIYLNALNLLFRDNFLQLSRFLESFHSFKTAYHNLNQKQKNLVNPLKEWERLEQQQINFITIHDPDYPHLLKEISYPPWGLYYWGDLSVLNNPLCLAVVGTRKISAYGKLVVEKIIKELIPYNFVVISGLALGVDTLSHKTTLNEGGKTVAILGTGLDQIFPRANESLSRQIIKNGALITEYPLGSKSFKSHFPWRNRIISGLASATLVIEAPEKSGALITANFAVEQNRDVFAIPGSIFNNNSTGTNKLIQQGAKLITKAEDILTEYHLAPKSQANKIIDFDNDLEKQIYELINLSNQISIDKIIEKINLNTNEVLIALTSLEMKEVIKNIGNGDYVKIN
jgi:DNA processing protein